MLAFNKRGIVLIGILIIIVLVLIFIIFSLNTQSSSNNLIGYQTIKAQAKALSSNPSIADKADYGKFIAKIALLENSSLTKQQKLGLLKDVTYYLDSLYFTTQDHNLYLLAQNLKSFIEKNYGNTYTYSPSCNDPQCATEPIPNEIKTIINEINSSDIPKVSKDAYILNLTNFSYLKNEEDSTGYNLKIGSFITLAQSIKSDSDFTKAGLNEKIYNQIINYLKSTYPQEYSNFHRGS